MNLNSIFSRIVNNRQLYMGVAMIMVVMYHSGLSKDAGMWKIFYPGFLGVDIFLFLSGYGLCHSFVKNDLKTFYLRRFSRVLPLYILLSLVITCFIAFNGKDLSIFDWICNITTLNYLGFGGCFIEWFLSAILILYILFPFIFHVIRNILQISRQLTKSRENNFNVEECTFGFIILCAIVLCFIISIYAKLAWYYEAFAYRVPIFILGMLFYFSKSKISIAWTFIAYTIGLCAAVLMYFKGLVHTYVVFYMTAPFVLFFIGIVCDKLSDIFTNGVRWIGSNSLQIYVANSIVVAFIAEFTPPFLYGVTYWGGQLLIVPIIIYCNKILDNILKTK